MTYSKEDKHKSRYFVKERSSKYKGEQQGCSVTQGRTMDKENNSRSNHVEEDYNNRQIGDTEGDQEE